MSDVAKPIKCTVCKTRNAVYVRKVRAADKPEHVCATCMVACKAVFGDKPRHFRKIKYGS